jgi:hypothetical protein
MRTGKMKKFKFIFFGLILTAGLSIGASAQQNDPKKPPPKPPPPKVEPKEKPPPKKPGNENAMIQRREDLSAV